MSTTAEERRTHVRAQARFVRTAPRKAQLVVDQIRGRAVPEARTILAFLTRAAARDVEKVLISAVANAEANHGLIGDDLYVAEAYVGGGPMLKRYRARARGRVARIRKRSCHITIVLATPSDYEFVDLPEAPPVATEPDEEARETAAEAQAPPDSEELETSEDEADELESVAEPQAEEVGQGEPAQAAEALAAPETSVEEPEAADATTPAEDTAEQPEADEQPEVSEEPVDVDEPKPKPKPRRQARSRAKATPEDSAAEAEKKPAPKRRTQKKADKAEEEDKEG